MLLWVVVFILVLAVDDLVQEDCGGYDSCAGAVDDAVRTWYMIVLIVWACIYCPIGLIGLQVVYWGWKEMETRPERKEKEAEKKKEKKEAKKALE